MINLTTYAMLHTHQQKNSPHDHLSVPEQCVLAAYCVTCSWTRFTAFVHFYPYVPWPQRAFTWIQIRRAASTALDVVGCKRLRTQSTSTRSLVYNNASSAITRTNIFRSFYVQTLHVCVADMYIYARHTQPASCRLKI